MRDNRALILLMLVFIVILSTLAACGSSSDTISNVDNTKANGTFTFVQLMADNSMSDLTIARGTVIFNGDGTGFYALNSPSVESGPFTYTARSDNSISIEGEMSGHLRANGDFFVISNASSSTDGLMMLGIKNTSGADNSSMSGGLHSALFEYDTPGTTSSTSIQNIIVNGTGFGNATEIAPSVGAYADFTYTTNPDGTFTSNLAEEVGAVSNTGDISISADSTSNNKFVSFAAQKYTAGALTNSILNGTYMLHMFMDDYVPSSSFVISKASATFNGNGTVGYADLETSSGGALQSGIANYIVNTTTNDGTFYLEGDLAFMTPDGSVIAIIDTDDTDDSVSVMIGVKK